MTVKDLIGWVANGSLVLVFLLTLVELLRKRDRVSLDIHLMFAALAGVIAANLLRPRVHSVSWLRLVGPMLLLAHPTLLLRMIRHFYEVPAAVTRAVWAGLLGTWLIALLAPNPAPLSLLLILCAYFVAAEGYAAAAFFQGARATGGVTRQRLKLASLGSALMTALVFLVALRPLVPVLSPWVPPLVQVDALLAALSYYFGFVPPRPLRRFWQLSEFQLFLQRATSRPAADRARLALDDLCTAAIRVMGARTAAAALWDATAANLPIRASGEAAWIGDTFSRDEGVAGTVWRSGRARAASDFTLFGPTETRLAGAVGATALLAVPIARAGRTRGVLAVFLRRPPLFASDDLQLLALLADQAALALENAELLHRYEALVESAPDAIIAVSQTGEIQLVNAATEKLFGYSRAELMGRPVEILVPERIRVQHVVDRTRYTDHAVSRPMGSGRELLAVRKDGSEFPTEISLSPVGSDAGMIVMSIIRDISERKQAQREMERRNLQLESLNHELEAFSYSISHDLRTPLRAINGYCGIVQQQYGSLLPEEGIRYLDEVRRSAARMDHLIRGLLAASRMGRQTVNREPVAIAALAREVVAEMRDQETGTQASVQIGELPPCEADPVLVKQVLANLLANAFKFSRGRKTPQIELGSCRSEQGYACYFVKDNGVGFDMRYSDKLFGVFQRLHHVEEFEGSGVGLAIVKRIVQRHGGQVWAESELDRGAIFYFTLPTPS